MSVPVEEIKILVALLEQHQEPGERKEVVSKLYSVLIVKRKNTSNRAGEEEGGRMTGASSEAACVFRDLFPAVYDRDPSSPGYGGSEAEERFIASGGLGVVRLRIDCMEGDWMAEARNGTTDLLDKLARLPALQATFDRVSAIKETKVNDAIAAMHEMSHGGHGHSHGEGVACSHGHGHGHGHGPVDASRVDLSGLHEELKGVRAEGQGGGAGGTWGAGTGQG